MKRLWVSAFALTFLTGAAVTPIFAQDVGAGSSTTNKKGKKKKKNDTAAPKK